MASSTMSYDFEIFYNKGSDNKAADALSKVFSHELLSLALSLVSTSLNQQILDSYEHDTGIQKIIQVMQ